MNSRPQAYITTLTPLRGIAAIFVVIFHVNAAFAPFVPPNSTQLVQRGWLWVDFFFILSGFIISYTYTSYFENGTKFSDFKKYLGARFARVYPLNFITAIWCFILALVLHHYATSIQPAAYDMVNPNALPACLLLINSMHVYTNPPLNVPSWSLSTEWWVYLVFPLIIPVFARLKKNGKIVALLVIIGLYIFLKYVLGPVSVEGKGDASISMTADFGFLRCLIGFMSGMLLYEFYKSRDGYSLFKNSWCFVLLFFCVLAGLHFAVMDILVVALFPLVLLSAAYNETTAKRVLNTRLFQRLGDWSFSIYMVHTPIMLTLISLQIKKNPDLLALSKKVVQPDYGKNVVACIVVLVLTLLISAFTYRFIEIPMRNYLNKLFKTKQPKIDVASV